MTKSKKFVPTHIYNKYQLCCLVKKHKAGIVEIVIEDGSSCHCYEKQLGLIEEDNDEEDK